MSKIKNGGLDQYDTGPFEQRQFGTAVVEGVNSATYLLTDLGLHRGLFAVAQAVVESVTVRQTRFRRFSIC